MRNEEFAEASAYLRVLEKRLLSGDSVNRIADVAGVSEALKLLAQNSEYDFSSLRKTEDFEFVLKDGLIAAYETLYKLTSYREVIDILAAKYDFHNLKVILKAKYINKDMKPLYFSVTGLNCLDVESYAQKGDKKKSLAPYVVSAVDEAMAAYEKTEDPQTLDISLDKQMFSYMLELAEEVGSSFITEYVKLLIDFNNLKTLLRVKSMQKGTRFLSECLVPGGTTDMDFFVSCYDKSPDAMAGAFVFKHFGDEAQKGIEEYGRTGNYAKLEKLLDDCLIKYIKEAKYISYGPEVLFAYLVSKENEIRQIRILVTGKKYGVDTEALRERLRESYA